MGRPSSPFPSVLSPLIQSSQAYIVVALTNAHQYAFLYEAFRVTHKRLVNLEVDDIHVEDNVLKMYLDGSHIYIYRYIYIYEYLYDNQIIHESRIRSCIRQEYTHI